MPDEATTKPAVSYKVTPSILPYIAGCPCWEREKTPPNEAMLRGIKLDTALRRLLGGFQGPLGLTTKKDIEAVQWANVHIKTACPGHLVESSKGKCKFALTLDKYSIKGEMDAFCSPLVKVFDLKSGRYADYECQLMPYSLHLMNVSNTDKATAEAVFCDMKLGQAYEHEKAKVEDKLFSILVPYFSQDKTPKESYGCRYCRFRDKDTGACKFGR